MTNISTVMSQYLNIHLYSVIRKISHFTVIDNWLNSISSYVAAPALTRLFTHSLASFGCTMPAYRLGTLVSCLDLLELMSTFKFKFQIRSIKCLFPDRVQIYSAIYRDATVILYEYSKPLLVVCSISTWGI